MVVFLTQHPVLLMTALLAVKGILQQQKLKIVAIRHQPVAGNEDPITCCCIKKTREGPWQRVGLFNSGSELLQIKRQIFVHAVAKGMTAGLLP